MGKHIPEVAPAGDASFRAARVRARKALSLRGTQRTAVVNGKKQASWSYVLFKLREPSPEGGVVFLP